MNDSDHQQRVEAAQHHFSGAQFFGGKWHELIVQVQRGASHYHVPCMDQAPIHKRNLAEFPTTGMHRYVQIYERVASDVFVLARESYDFDIKE